MRKPKLPKVRKTGQWLARIVGIPSLFANAEEWKGWLRAVPWLAWLAPFGSLLGTWLMANWGWALLAGSVALLVILRWWRPQQVQPANARPKPRTWLDRKTANDIMRSSELVSEPPDFPGSMIWSGKTWRRRGVTGNGSGPLCTWRTSRWSALKL